jgi:hypothetical protein
MGRRSFRRRSVQQARPCDAWKPNTYRYVPTDVLVAGGCALIVTLGHRMRPRSRSATMESRFRRSITAVPNVRIRGDKLRLWKPRRKPTTKAKKTKVFCFFFSKKKAFLLVFLPHPCGWFHPMKGRAHAHAAGHDARVERLRAKEGRTSFLKKRNKKLLPIWRSMKGRHANYANSGCRTARKAGVSRARG